MYTAIRSVIVKHTFVYLPFFVQPLPILVQPLHVLVQSLTILIQPLPVLVQPLSEASEAYGVVTGRGGFQSVTRAGVACYSTPTKH